MVCLMDPWGSLDPLLRIVAVHVARFVQFLWLYFSKLPSDVLLSSLQKPQFFMNCYLYLSCKLIHLLSNSDLFQPFHNIQLSEDEGKMQCASLENLGSSLSEPFYSNMSFLSKCQCLWINLLTCILVYCHDVFLRAYRHAFTKVLEKKASISHESLQQVFDV